MPFGTFLTFPTHLWNHIRKHTPSFGVYLAMKISSPPKSQIKSANNQIGKHLTPTLPQICVKVCVKCVVALFSKYNVRILHTVPNNVYPWGHSSKIVNCFNCVKWTILLGRNHGALQACVRIRVTKVALFVNFFFRVSTSKEDILSGVSSVLGK